MGLRWPWSDADTQEKLTRIAYGNIDLVHEAIRAAHRPDKPADLEDVVAYILKHRDERRNKVA